MGKAASEESGGILNMNIVLSISCKCIFWTVCTSRSQTEYKIKIRRLFVVAFIWAEIKWRSTSHTFSLSLSLPSYPSILSFFWHKGQVLFAILILDTVFLAVIGIETSPTSLHFQFTKAFFVFLRTLAIGFFASLLD